MWKSQLQYIAAWVNLKVKYAILQDVLWLSSVLWSIVPFS